MIDQSQPPWLKTSFYLCFEIFSSTLFHPDGLQAVVLVREHFRDTVHSFLSKEVLRQPKNAFAVEKIS